MPTDKQPDPISAEVERALFKRFWTWLAVVGTLVFVVVSGFSVIASQLITSLISDKVSAATDKINGLETRSLDSLERIQQKSIDAAITTANAQSRSAAAAAAAQEAVDRIQKALSVASGVDTLLKDTDAIVTGLLNNKAFNERVSNEINDRVNTFTRNGQILAMIRVQNNTVAYASGGASFSRDGTITFQNPSNLKVVPLVTINSDSSGHVFNINYISAVTSPTTVVVRRGALDTSGRDWDFEDPTYKAGFTAAILGF